MTGPKMTKADTLTDGHHELVRDVLELRSIWVQVIHIWHKEDISALTWRRLAAFLHTSAHLLANSSLGPLPVSLEPANAKPASIMPPDASCEPQTVSLGSSVPRPTSPSGLVPGLLAAR